METKIVDLNDIVSFISISGEGDLKLKSIINTNPPPVDETCDCCGRHISEVKPFGKAGDPLVGDFKGALLITKCRSIVPFDEQMDKIANKFLKNCKTKDECIRAEERLVEELGEKEAKRITIYYSGYGMGEKFREYKDCAILDDKKFYDRMNQRFMQENNKT
jgi:hypothetical protein